MGPFLKRFARLSGQLANACMEHQGTALHSSNTKFTTLSSSPMEGRNVAYCFLACGPSQPACSPAACCARTMRGTHCNAHSAQTTLYIDAMEASNVFDYVTFHSSLLRAISAIALIPWRPVCLRHLHTPAVLQCPALAA